MGKLVKVISPSYVKGFKCIGGVCEDSCCIGWDIDIDKLTFRKYFRTKDPQMKQEFRKHVYKNEECDSEEVDYGRMFIKKDKWCPFLDEDKLCKIYSNLGEDYLSNVCHSYPRVYNILNGVYELSLYMSCPEAIRKLLSRKEKIKFTQEEVSLGKHIVHSYVDTSDKRMNRSPVKRLKELRTMSIKIVQDRDFSIQKRLLKLGYKLERDSFSESLDKNSSYIFQVGFFNNVIKSLNVFEEIDSPAFIEYTKKVLSGFKLQESTTLIESALVYEKVMKTIVDPFVERNGYLFEHFLVNTMYQGNFPFSVNQDMFDGYLMLVVRYTFIRFYLAGIAATAGKITIDDVVLMIQIHTKTISHHKTFIPDLLLDIKDKDFDNMEFISILLGEISG